MTMSSKNRVKITWSIDSELVKKVKHEAIDRGTDASSVVEEAIRSLLSPDSKGTVAAKKAWETRRKNSE